MPMTKIARSILSILVFQVGSIGLAAACSRILWNDNKVAVVVARTMDWSGSTEPVLTVFPRGMQRHGGRTGEVTTVADNPAVWISKYGSLVTTIFGVGTAEGLNEAGLGAHMLYLDATDFGSRDTRKPGLQAGLWVQYVLDNAADVDEALTLLEHVQVVLTEARGAKAKVHLAIEDASGDSAVVEYIGGKPIVHHSREFRIVTNDPAYDQQLAGLRQQDFSKPARDARRSRAVIPADRFQRAAYYTSVLPEPRSEPEAVSGVLTVARNVSVPSETQHHSSETWRTEYRTAINLTDKRYYFELTTSPNIISADLSKFDLAPGAPVMLLNPSDTALSGDVTANFQPAARAPF